MALEAIGLTSNIASLNYLELAVRDGLLRYCKPWGSTEDDVNAIKILIDSLGRSFAIIRRLLQGLRLISTNSGL